MENAKPIDRCDYSCHAKVPTKPATPRSNAPTMSMPLRAAALWLCMAIGGEMPEADVPMPEPALGDKGGVNVLLLPYSAVLLEPGAPVSLGELAPALAPAAAAAEA